MDENQGSFSTQQPGQNWQQTGAQQPGQTDSGRAGNPYYDGYYENTASYSPPPTNPNPGYSAGGGAYRPNEEPEPPKGLAIASLVCGIISICACCFGAWLSVLAGIGGLVTGILAKSKMQGGSAMSTAGIICSVIGILLGVIAFIAAFFGLLSYAWFDWWY